MAELLDIYDENLVKLGTKERANVHYDGDWHRVFHCWIIYQGTDNKDYLVVQRRAPDKDFFPNLLDVSAAGHYEAGETIEDGVREIKEELGVDVFFADLIPLGAHVDVARYKDLCDREFAEVFFLISSMDIRAYRLQPEEVSELAVFSIDDGLAMCAGQRDSIEARAVGMGRDTITIHPDDFVPRADAYLYKILVLAKRCLNGENHLVV